MVENYKYKNLMGYFSNLHVDFIKLTFNEIENIIDFKLPDSAYKYSAYWHKSETHTICQSWTKNGWKMIGVKLGQYVEFERESISENTIIYKLEIYSPKNLIPKMIEEITKLGACRVGNYDNVASYYEIEGCWRPLGESTPFTGEKNKINYGKEYKLEIRCEEQYVKTVLKKIREIHPYEEALINVIKLYNRLFE